MRSLGFERTNKRDAVSERAVGEVERRLAARRVVLREHDVLVGAVQRPPVADVPLQRAELAGLEPAREPPPELVEDGLRLQLPVLVLLQQRHHDLVPHLDERVGLVRHVRAVTHSEGSGPSCHFRAVQVRSLMPTAAAAASCVISPFISFFLNSSTCSSVTMSPPAGSTSPGDQGRPRGPAEVVVVDRQ